MELGKSVLLKVKTTTRKRLPLVDRLGASVWATLPEENVSKVLFELRLPLSGRVRHARLIDEALYESNK